MKLKGLGKKSTEMLWKKFKEQLSNYLPLTGGTMKGLLNVPYGTVVHYNYGTNGSYGYVRLATIVIKAAYVDAPIELTIMRRGDSHPTKIVILFNSTSSNDPTVSTFNVVGATANVWIYKSAASTWELYVKKIGAWDEVDVTEYHKHLYLHDRITVTWQKDHISTLPDGAVQATVGEFLGVASKSTGIVDYNDKNEIVKIGYAGNSLDYSSLAFLAGYTYDRKIKNVSKDAVKAYLGIDKGVLPKYDAEHNWKSKDPVLLAGEMAISSDKNGMYKVGNGSSKWSELSYSYMNSAVLPSSSNTNKGKFAKFATVDLSNQGAYGICSGVLLFNHEEGTAGAKGTLFFHIRNGSTAGVIVQCTLNWLSINSSTYSNSIFAVKVNDGKYDFYYKPMNNWDTPSVCAICVDNPKLLSFKNGSFIDSITPVTTSSVSSYASSAKSASEVNGHTVDADVPSDAKFTDTTYTEFQGTEGMSDGAPGLVPAPKASEFGNSYGLGSDGTWRDFGQTFVSQSFAEEAYVTNEALKNAIEELKKYVDKQSPGGVTLDSVYPVGSIYISVNDNFDPNNVFPGTWVSFGKGRTLVGVDTSGPEFQSSEDTGGEKTHVLTVDELPEHNHDVTVENKELTGSVWNFVGQNAKFGPGNSTSGVFSKGGDGTCFYPSSTGKAVGVNDGFTLDATHDHTATSGNTGSGTAHNNMPPYITVYMWKRTE